MKHQTHQCILNKKQNQTQIGDQWHNIFDTLIDCIAWKEQEQNRWVDANAQIQTLCPMDEQSQRGVG